MAVAPVLVVAFVFNPPAVSVVGPIQESTIAKLNELLPHLTTNSSEGRRQPPSFVPVEGPLHGWKISLPSLLCDEIAKLRFMLAVLDALENEGGWSMHDTHAVTRADTEEFTFFFNLRAR